jgi:hypothetical protein
VVLTGIYNLSTNAEERTTMRTRFSCRDTAAYCIQLHTECTQTMSGRLDSYRLFRDRGYTATRSQTVRGSRIPQPLSTTFHCLELAHFDSGSRPTSGPECPKAMLWISELRELSLFASILSERSFLSASSESTLFGPSVPSRIP